MGVPRDLAAKQPPREGAEEEVAVPPEDEHESAPHAEIPCGISGELPPEDCTSTALVSGGVARPGPEAAVPEAPASNLSRSLSASPASSNPAAAAVIGTTAVSTASAESQILVKNIADYRAVAKLKYEQQKRARQCSQFSKEPPGPPVAVGFKSLHDLLGQSLVEALAAREVQSDTRKSEDSDSRAASSHNCSRSTMDEEGQRR